MLHHGPVVHGEATWIGRHFPAVSHGPPWIEHGLWAFLRVFARSNGCSWCLAGRRKLIRYEAPQGRRVNALAAYRPYGGSPRLDVFTAERTWNSYDLIGFLKALPWSKAPRVVVLDDAGLHTSKVIRRARRALSAAGIYLYFLPTYSPELNPCEQARDMIRDETGNRVFKTITELRKAALPALQRFWNDAGAVLRLVGRPWLALQANVLQPMQKSS